MLETTAALAESFERRAREEWEAEAELTEDGGAQPPAHIRDAYEQLRAAGLVSLMVPDAYGGAALPGLLNGFYLEMISRADTSLVTVVGLQAGVAVDIEKYGDDALKESWLPRFASGEVQGAMGLTEPKAGSDLGGITTRCTEQADGSLRVDGAKIFITNGGAEVHLVLARDADLVRPIHKPVAAKHAPLIELAARMIVRLGNAVSLGDRRTAPSSKPIAWKVSVRPTASGPPEHRRLTLRSRSRSG